MNVIRDTRRLKGKMKSPILTLGNFDGVHLGHQRILKGVKKRAIELGCPSVVYTFEPHPLKVVAPHRSPPLITAFEEKVKLVGAFGIDFLVCARFTKRFADQHPRRFVKEVLADELEVREVWVGHDYAFGRGKRGTVGYLKELGREFGFRVRVIPAYERGGEVVSSSRVRRLIQKGVIKEVIPLLGRPYALEGVVEKGRNRGKALGFPTANMRADRELLPRNGVYAVFVTLGGKVYQGVCNIGVSPTFGRGGFTIEVYIIDFKGSIYGRRMKVAFVDRIRDEIHFKTPELLAEEIKKDVERAKRIMSNDKVQMINLTVGV
ncbi:MAG: bifunctional riboflavin kinase/FAD synthetase [Deltaproteobacteria bacterium]|nr:bifunctional riboflavin kinase/FAD synthetase [Deltaproteobacteria bacterium]